MSKKTTTATTQQCAIKAPQFETLMLRIRGTAPYVQHKFSAKAKAQIMATQAAGSTAKTKKVREAKDFDEVCRNATHYSREGWIGIPAASFRNAMISACRTVGFKMTLAKLACWVIADGFDADDGSPLVKIIGDHKRHDMYARNDNGSVDIRSRPMWETWEAEVCIRYDAGVLNRDDIINLMMRVGMQVGIGEGRPDSKNSAGMGWGTFELVGD